MQQINQIQRQTITKKKKRKGICATCGNELDCTFPAGQDAAVRQCEEFDLINSVPGNGGSVKNRTGSAVRAGAVILDTPSGRGLCSNCENSASCSYPKPEGGVWHCEEYR